MGMGQQLRWGMLPQAGRDGGTARRLSASEASVEQGKKEGGGGVTAAQGSRDGVTTPEGACG